MILKRQVSITTTTTKDLQRFHTCDKLMIGMLINTGFVIFREILSTFCSSRDGH
jgi:hypothetical protein